MIHHASRPVAIGLLLGILVLGMSCSGPSVDQSESSESDAPAKVYHVQLDMTEKKDTAHQTLGAALAWWDEQAESVQPRLLESGSSVDRPAHIEWKAPYYRVRIGPFASRAEARKVLQAAQSAFPNAFIAPERRSSQATSP